jgi:hypothetical protein
MCPRTTQIMPSSNAKKESCLNCGRPLVGAYCAQCGQQDIDRRQPFWKLLADILRETFDFDSRVARTLSALLIRPGFLTLEYCAGRRAKFSPPLRLYLLVSVLFFLSLTLQRGFLPNIIVQETPAVSEAASTAHTADDPLGMLDVYPELAEAVRDYVPVLIFLLLPVFALLLKLLYRNKFYFEHLIYALHTHTILFIFTGLMLPFEEPAGKLMIPLAIQLVLFAYILWYLFRSLRVVYQESRKRTTLKMFVLVILYSGIAALSTEVLVHGALSYAGVAEAVVLE